MKNLFIGVIFIVVLTGCGRSIPDFEVSENDPELFRASDGQLLHKNEPFSGYLLEHYADGSLKSRSSYLDGFLEAASRGYYPDGQLMYVRPYVRGEKDGTHTGFFPDGSKRFVYYFEDGLSVGTHRDWYERGQMAKETNYKDGRPFGSQKMWRPDGKIRSNYVVREDGRRYGLIGMKRCKNIDTEKEEIKPLTASVYDK